MIHFINISQKVEITGICKDVQGIKLNRYMFSKADTSASDITRWLTVKYEQLT